MPTQTKQLWQDASKRLAIFTHGREIFRRNFATATHPLLADGTDCFQVRFWAFEAKSVDVEDRLAQHHCNLAKD
jgi:hypothetical protein